MLIGQIVKSDKVVIRTPISLCHDEKGIIEVHPFQPRVPLCHSLIKTLVVHEVNSDVIENSDGIVGTLPRSKMSFIQVVVKVAKQPYEFPGPYKQIDGRTSELQTQIMRHHPAIAVARKDCRSEIGQPSLLSLAYALPHESPESGVHHLAPFPSFRQRYYAHQFTAICLIIPTANVSSYAAKIASMSKSSELQSQNRPYHMP